MTLPARIKPHATIGTVAGLIDKFLDDDRFPEKIVFELKRCHAVAMQALVKLPYLNDYDLYLVSRELDSFFGAVFEKGKTRHVLTFIEFFIAIIDDMQIRNGKILRLVDLLMRARTAITEQFQEWPACTVAGARIANRWGEIWEQ